MNITTEIRIRFANLRPGQTFISVGGDVFLKLENDWRKETKWNAVRLKDGYLDRWKNESLVTPILLKVTESINMAKYQIKS